MSSRLSKQEVRRAGFKKAIDGDEARRKREDHQVEIRKAKREENLTVRPPSHLRAPHLPPTPLSLDQS